MGVFTQVSAAAAGSLVAAVWEGVVLTACVALALRLLPGITAAARSVVWSAAMAAVVALPFVHFPGGGAGAGAARVQLDERLSVGLICVWAALSLWRGVELVRSAIWLRGIARRGRPVEAEAGVAALLSAGGQVALCTSDEVDRPSVVGFFRPRILVPATLLAKLSGAELEQIVLHEVEHLRRGDDWTNLLQKMSLVLFPLNPVLVWIERRLCLERELACDDRVLRATNARKAYAACLANLAEHSLVRRGVSLALGAWERQSELVRRVHRILLRPDREMGRRQVTIAVSVMVAGLLVGADGLAHSPRLVSFGPVASSELAGASAPQAGAEAPHVVLTSFVGLKPHGSTERRAATVVPNGRQGAAMTSLKMVPVKQPIRRPAGDGVSNDMVDAVERATNIGRPALTERLATMREPDQAAPEGSAMVVLVTWRTVVVAGTSTDGSSANAAPVTKFSQTTYAAVPTRNGWLFVQL